VRSFFETENFRSRDILKQVIRAIVLETSSILEEGGLYVLLIDGTCIQRGGDTLVPNGTKYKEKKIHKKGKRSTKAHSFTMGLLILPNGMRIPMPRYSYYSKNYCKKNKMKYTTQHEDACKLIEYARGLVPMNAEFAIVADGFYDSKIIFETCKKVKSIYITTADSGRVYAPKKKIYDRGLNKKSNSKKLVIIKGEEKHTREHIRYAKSGSGKNKKDHYMVNSEKLNLSNLGEIQIVYSWKNIRQGKKNSSSYKILLCNDLKISTCKIVELYALRWQVEIYFRELKSEIGLCDYAGKDFRAQERYVDMNLLAYLFLEWDRSEKLKIEKSKIQKGRLKKMRTRGLITLLKKNSIMENIHIYKCANKFNHLENAA